MLRVLCIRISLIFLLFLSVHPIFGRQTVLLVSPDSLWADSVCNTLTLDEQIGQMIFARANKDNIFLPEIPSLITDYHIGGVVFFKCTPVRQAHKTNEYQSLSEIPLLVSIDAERGLAMRLDSTTGFPFAMTVGATGDTGLTARMADLIGKDCKRMGIHMNFGPVVDINSNPSNPVINMRSFGQDKVKVSQLAQAWIRGHRKHGILTTAKHFPGHGDTDTDSHLALPVLLHSRGRLDSIDLYPYKYLIRDGLEGIMIAHLFVPVVDTLANTPSTLSKKTVTGLLKEEMNFNGLIVTDALEMGGVTRGFRPGEIELNALKAGNDILLMPQDVPLAIQSICAAADTNPDLQFEIREHCRKILLYKYRAGLQTARPVETRGLTDDLNTVEHKKIAEEIMQKSASLIKNTGNLLPIQRLDTLRIACIILGDSTLHPFQKYLGSYAPVKNVQVFRVPDPPLSDSLIRQLDSCNLVIAGLTNTSILSSRDYGISEKTAAFIARLAQSKPLILSLFGNPYALNRRPDLASAAAILITYQDNPLSWKTSAEILFGARPVSGKIPVSISPEYPLETGIFMKNNNRLLQLNPALLNEKDSIRQQIDSLIQSGIQTQAYPGCQVLYARNGIVLFDKAFGTAEYDSTRPVSPDDLYDLASLTKVLATTLAVMKLSEERKILLDEPLSNYLPELKNSNKSRLIIRDIMCHQAGLKSWIPFYRQLLRDDQPDTVFIKSVPFPNSVQIGDSCFISTAWQDTIYRQIIESPLEKNKNYLYSDLGFILMKVLVERISGQAFDAYLNENFYRPMGLQTLGFHPLQRFPANRIMPTEQDTVFRNQLIRGYVHDPAAVMLGGIAGHAGLFGNARDIAILLQMLLNKGTYGGVRYFREETVRNFTSVQFPWYDNRRGIGFDKPLLIPNPNGPSCLSASPDSYGHSGFTGTYFWADPANQSLFIFLSNRVYPDAGNNRLSKSNLRTRLHELFYQLKQ